jgi:hypothetical protein
LLIIQDIFVSWFESFKTGHLTINFVLDIEPSYSIRTLIGNVRAIDDDEDTTQQSNLIMYGFQTCSYQSFTGLETKDRNLCDLFFISNDGKIKYFFGILFWNFFFSSLKVTFIQIISNRMIKVDSLVWSFMLLIMDIHL